MSARPLDEAFVAVVHGTVQGVGFRYYTRSAAHLFGVRGYVQNQGDGTVKVVCEGRPAAVEKMTEWLKKGPPSARVTHVDLSPCEPAGYPAFTVEF